MPAKKKVTKKKVAKKKAAAKPKVPLFTSCAHRERWEREHGSKVKET